MNIGFFFCFRMVRSGGGLHNTMVSKEGGAFLSCFFSILNKFCSVYLCGGPSERCQATLVLSST